MFTRWKMCTRCILNRIISNKTWANRKQSVLNITKDYFAHVSKNYGNHSYKIVNTKNAIAFLHQVNHDCIAILAKQFLEYCELTLSPSVILLILLCNIFRYLVQKMYEFRKLKRPSVLKGLILQPNKWISFFVCFSECAGHLTFGGRL